jgi:hypothetical protein
VERSDKGHTPGKRHAKCSQQTSSLFATVYGEVEGEGTSALFRIEDNWSLSLSTRLFCDAVIKCLDFGVYNFENASTVDTLLTSCGGFTGGYCLDELREDDAAFFVNGRTIHTVMRCAHAPNTGSGQRRILITLRRADCRGIRQAQEKKREC